MLRARLRPPLWFELLIALLGCLVVYWVAWHFPHTPHAGARPGGDLQYGFLGAILAVANAIWIGIQAIGHASLVVLEWSVNALWILARAAGKALIEIGKDTITAFRRSWGFIKLLYDDVLKPAWQKFWKVIDWARHALERVFGPVIKFLRHIRTELLKFYAKWVRPVLDTIELARHVLQVLKKLGIEWAGKLDAKLAGVEDWIQERFLFVLRKVNEVINVVNRVVTLDGLFQRLALVRSIERDIRYVSRAFTNWRQSPITQEQFDEISKKASERPPDKTAADLAQYFEEGTGYYQPIIDEMAAQVRISLEAVTRGSV